MVRAASRLTERSSAISTQPVPEYDVSPTPAAAPSVDDDELFALLLCGLVAPVHETRPEAATNAALKILAHAWSMNASGGAWDESSTSGEDWTCASTAQSSSVDFRSYSL